MYVCVCVCVCVCRAFAIVETIASRYAIQYKHLYELSPQQLISCDYDPAMGLDGCNGGDIYVALSTLVEVSTYLIVGANQVHNVPHVEHV